MTCRSHVIKLRPSALKMYPHLMAQTWKGNLLSGHRYANIMRWSQSFFLICILFHSLSVTFSFLITTICQWHNNFRIVQVQDIIDTQFGHLQLVKTLCAVNSVAVSEVTPYNESACSLITGLGPSFCQHFSFQILEQWQCVICF